MSGLANNMSSAPADSTRIGYLLAPHGVQGGVKLFVLGDSEQLLSLGRVYVEKRGWVRLRKIEPLNVGVVLHLAGVTTREGAAELRGSQVYAADAELPPLEEGHYYYHQLRGLPLYGSDGQQLGQVKDVEDMGHQDLLVVAHTGGESFVPLQAPYVVVEMASNAPAALRLTEEAPEDLLDTSPQESK